jgi:hypothetical protein
MRLFKPIATCWFALLFLLVAFEPPSEAAITLELLPSSPSPATLGTLISWTVHAKDTSAGVLLYRFKAGPANGNVRVVRDFSSSSGFDWTTIDSEGNYMFEVDVKNNLTGEIAYASSSYEMLPLADANPVISGTQNPLVFIYSALPCTDGAMIQVQFWRSDGHGPAQTTQSQRCRSTSTINFYLAGMEANTTYTVRHSVTQNGQSTIGPMMSLTTGSVPTSIAGLSAANQTVLQASSAGEKDWILLQGPIGLPPFATDLDGNIIWYYPQPLTFLTRPDSAGRFFGINNSGTDASGSVLRVFDLAGNTIQETNAATVNTQLASLGKRQIGVFHHEARRLSNGNIVTLGTVEQILPDVQGPGPVDVVGDMIIVLDRDFQVVWTWDAFDYLDVTRQAVLGETCSNSNSCMSHFLASDGNDWTHANAVQQTPEGSLIISLRHQDWVVKVDYENGAGDGHILWRLGNAGDFTIQSNDTNAWFSHQHDPNFLEDNVSLELFDNGNTRRAADVNANSRGQVLVVNEDNRTVSLSLNRDLGVYSGALGSAQRLPNGDYHFDAGFIGANAISFEVTSAGGTMRAIQAGAVEYRTFRLRDLYSGLN